MAIRLMVIDDDSLSLTLLSLLLEREGFAVMQASSGEDALHALETLETCESTAVLVDQRMPGLSGVELATALRSRVGNAVPLLAMSATEQRRPDGYDGFLLKPLDVGALKAMLADGREQRMAEARHLNSEECPDLEERTYEKLLALMPETALREVYDACLRDVRTRVEKMRVGDAQGARAGAHAIKGSAGMLGAARLARIAALLEEGVYQKEELPHLLDELLAACESVERILLRK